MSFGNKLRVNYALESDELGDGATEVPAEELVIDGSETAEGQGLEVAEAAEEVTAETTDLELMEEDHESLESIYLDVQAAVKDGGLSVQAAKAYRHAIRASCGKHGYVSKDDTPCLESFGGVGSAYHDTVALEADIGKMLKDFWEAIMAQLRKTYNAIVGWFKKIMDQTPKIKQRAQELVKKADATTGTAGEAEIELGLGKALSIGGKAPDKSAFDKTLNNVTATLVYLQSGLSDSEAAINGLSTFLKGMGTGKASEETYDALKTALTGQMGKLSITGGTPKQADRFGADISITTADELFGNRACAQLKQRGNDAKGKDFTLVQIVKGSGPAMIDYDTEAKIEGKQKFRTLDKEEAKAIGTAIVGWCDKVSAYKAVWEKRSTEFNNMDKDAKAVIANAKKTAEGDDKGKLISKIKDAALAQTQVWRKYTSFESSIVGYVTKLSFSLFTYADKSLATFKKAEATA